MRDLINELPSETLNRGLDSFRNSKDCDIEEFLRFKALKFEERRWCATYLLVNVEDFRKNRLNIEGYFTLSNKVLNISDKVSKSRKKKLFNGLMKDDKSLHVILIGQLAKHIDETGDSPKYGNTSMTELLDAAFEVIETVNERIPCRCVLLECRKSSCEDSEEDKLSREKLHQKYKDYNFSSLQEDDNLVQYVIMI